LKSIHLCNIANVAYGYCKILNEAGYPVDLRCHDIKHLMSQPEWDDLELDPADFPDENNFYNNTADFGDYRRPQWYVSDEMWTLNNGHSQKFVEVLRRILPSKVKHSLIPFYHALMKIRTSALQYAQQGADNMGKTFAKRVNQIAEKSRLLEPKKRVNTSTLRRYLPHTHWLHNHLNDHEVIFAYVFSPVYAMIHGQLPYISVEIGTMRDIPFDGSDMSKALWLSYKNSNHVLITNPDNNKRAEEYGITNYSFCPHPLDEDLYAPVYTKNSLRKEIRLSHQSDFIVFAPARQNWKIKGNDKYFSAFSRLIDSGVRATLLVPGWGQEINRSKNLCSKLGIENRVKWLSPMSERMLIKYYQASDIVLDQFNLGVFGLITPKALSCAKPVITSYDRQLNQWCFPEHPPVLSCNSVDDIYRVMNHMANSPNAKIQTGKKSRAWILKHHAKDKIRKILITVMEKAKENFEKRKSHLR